MIFLWVVLAIFLVFGLTVIFGAPYVPTRKPDVVDAFENLYPLKESDVVVDIGSGDGIVLRTAARYGAKAIGYEINPILVVISWLLARGNPRVTTRLANFWHTKLPHDTTVVYVFGVSRDIGRISAKLQKEALRLGHPIYLLSYGFELSGKKAIRRSKSHHLYEFR